MCCWSDRLCRSCILVLWRFNVQPNCDLNDRKPPLTVRNIMFGSMLCWVCHDLVCCLVFWLLLTVALCQISHLNTTNSTRRCDVGAQFYLLMDLKPLWEVTQTPWCRSDEARLVSCPGCDFPLDFSSYLPSQADHSLLTGPSPHSHIPSQTQVQVCIQPRGQPGLEGFNDVTTFAL